MNPIELSKFKKFFEKEVIKVMLDFKVPGMSFFIMKDGDVFYNRSFGYRDIIARKPATEDTLYGIASLTKSLTCLAILQLQQQDKLNVYDPISKYVPFDLTYQNEPITLHHAMSHSTGLSCLNSYESIMVNQGWRANIPVFPMGSWDDFYLHVNNAQSELLFPPGSKYYYCNEGFTILSQIIEKVSGVPYEEYMKENIFKKLGMTQTTFFRTELEKNVNASTGSTYDKLEDGFTRSPASHLSSPYVSGAGGLNSSVKEMTHYLQLHLNKGIFDSHELLNESLLNEMYKSHNPHSKTKLTEFSGYNPEIKSYYGYGLRIYEKYHGHTLITHKGNSGFSGGNIGIIPELNISIVQLYNVNWIPSYLFHTAVVLMLGENPEEMMPYYKRKKHFKRLCGNYKSYKGTTSIKIENRNGMLNLIDNNWQDKLVYPLIPKEFSNPEEKEYYRIDPAGTLDILFTEQEDGNIICEYERRILHKNLEL